MNASNTTRSKLTMKQSFRQLIQTLRNKTDLQQKINAKTIKPVSSQQFNKNINDILPITQMQRQQRENDKQLMNGKIETDNRSQIFNKFTEDSNKHVINFEGCIEEKNQNENAEEIYNLNFLVNQITTLLRPQQKMNQQKNEGRVGTIMHQRVSINRKFRPSQQQRYSKIKRSNILPSKAQQIVKKRINMKEVDENQIIKFWNENNKINDKSSSEELSKYFQKLIDQIQVELISPIIKKYKNCVYFGNRQVQYKYEGLILYYQNKIYFGQFLNGSKHGHGVEINFQNNTKFAGNFFQGKKKGFFVVQKQRQNYEGNLEYGIYEGKGKLMTEDYIYDGLFQNGKKHGYGQEFYPKTGLKLHGYFKNGDFQNMDKNKIKPDPNSQNLLKNKLQNSVTKSSFNDINFRVEAQLKKQMSNLSMLSNYRSQQSNDCQSLFDLMTNKKSQKYDLSVQKLKKLPKIRIEGLLHNQYDNENEENIIFNKYKPSPKEYQQKRLNHRRFNFSQNKPILYSESSNNRTQYQQPILKHRFKAASHRFENK